MVITQRDRSCLVKRKKKVEILREVRKVRGAGNKKKIRGYQLVTVGRDPRGTRHELRPFWVTLSASECEDWSGMTRKNKFQWVREMSRWEGKKKGKKEMGLSKDFIVLEIRGTCSDRPASRRASWPWQSFGILQQALKVCRICDQWELGHGVNTKSQLQVQVQSLLTIGRRKYKRGKEIQKLDFRVRCS